MPNYLVTYRMLGEPERQTRMFDTKKEAETFVAELLRSPALEDDGVVLWEAIKIYN